MTEKRYFDGTLAKWYYSRNNVISDGTNEYYLGSKESTKDWNYDDLLGTNDLLDELNRLSDENEQLKKSVKRQQGSNNECAKLIKEQQKENEQLKHKLKSVNDNFNHLRRLFNEIEEPILMNYL